MGKYIDYGEIREKLVRWAYEINFGVLMSVRDGLESGRVYHLEKDVIELIKKADDGALIRAAAANRILFKPVENKVFNGTTVWVDEDAKQASRMVVFALLKFVSDCADLFGESSRLVLGRALDVDGVQGNGIEDMIDDAKKSDHIIELNCNRDLFVRLIEAAIEDNEDLLNSCKNNLATTI